MGMVGTRSIPFLRGSLESGARIILFRRPFQALQRILNTGGEGFRTQCLKKPATPTWREDKVSAILHTTRAGIDTRTGKMFLQLHAKGEIHMHTKLVPLWIYLLNVKGRMPVAPKCF
jgi:hypothetical protein